MEVTCGNGNVHSIKARDNNNNDVANYKSDAWLHYTNSSTPHVKKDIENKHKITCNFDKGLRTTNFNNYLANNKHIKDKVYKMFQHDCQNKHAFSF